MTPLIALALFAAAAAADDPPSGSGPDAPVANDARDAELAELHKQIDALRARVDALPAAAPPAPPPAEPQPSDALSEPRLVITGMGSFNGVADLIQRDRAFDERAGAVFGNVDLFFLSHLSEEASFLAELVFEVNENTGELVFDFERVYLSVDVAPWLQLDIGRGHLATSMWNRRFHHGDWLQTPAKRPPYYEFEDGGGLVPAHYVGVDAHGDIDVPGVRLTYSATLANGRGFTVDKVLLGGDVDLAKLAGGALWASPSFVPGLSVGVNGWLDFLPSDDPRARPANSAEVIAGASAAYVASPVELLAEVSVIGHQFGAAPTSLTVGGYAQLGWAFGSLKPYYRLDFVRAPPGGDRYFGDEDQDTLNHTLGCRWDVQTFVALKIEASRLDVAGAIDNRGTLQLAFAF